MPPSVRKVLSLVDHFLHGYSLGLDRAALRSEVTQLVHSFRLKLDSYDQGRRSHSSSVNNNNSNSDPHDMYSKIYSNHYLNLSDVNVIGFDLDYTLVNYTEELQHLIYTLARNNLVSINGYPKELLGCRFDPQFAIRGLSVDTRHGVLCKLSHLQRLAISRTVRGKNPPTSDELTALYGESRHVSHGELSRMKPLNDLFSIAEACLIADTVELFHSKQARTGESYVPSSVVEDVQTAISTVHVDGTMQSAVLADPARFIRASPQLGSMLDHLMSSGKQMFLCTNSGYSYTNRALQYALGLPAHSSDWRQLFDVVVCSARKPDFYKSRLPFRQLDIATGSPTAAPVSSLARGGVYIQGSARALQEAMGWQGHELLYIGDNLRTDLVEAKRWYGWHTGCVINELESEVAVQQSERYRELRFLRSTLRHFIRDLQVEMRPIKGKTSSSEEEGKGGCVGDLRTEGELLRSTELELYAINTHLSKLFNANFGSMFRTDGEPTLFAFTMLRYVDLYMSDVSHLLSYDPSHRFYPHHAMHMAHDPLTSSIT